MNEQVETLIVGGGIAGLSTAWWLASNGHGRVALLEREASLCACSSGLNAAILRTVGDDPWVTEACARSAAVLRRPPRGFSDVPLIDPCGLILLANEEEAAELDRWIRGTPAGVRFEPLTPARLHSLAPHFEGRPARAYWFPEEGHLDIAAICEGFRRCPPGADVELRTSAGVRELIRDGDRIVGARLTDGNEVTARTTVIAAGAWAGGLVPDSPVAQALRPTRRHLMVTAPDGGVHYRWPVVWSLSDRFYCRPESGGMLLSACDEDGVDPDRCCPESGVCEVIAAKAQRLVPALADAEAAHFWCGMRTLTRDGRFAIGHDPMLGGLFWVAGLGGHGMVASFEIGRLAAGLIDGSLKDERLATRFDPARFEPVATP
jgi:D-arginine dehydrogenase